MFQLGYISYYGASNFTKILSAHTDSTPKPDAEYYTLESLHKALMDRVSKRGTAYNLDRDYFIREDEGEWHFLFKHDTRENKYGN